MATESKRTNVNKTDAIKFKAIADDFYNCAALAVDAKRWNAAGLLIIHAAIAYADAVTIKYAGVKSSGENHNDVVRLLETKVRISEVKSNALNQLERLIAHKTTIAYSGELYDEKDINNSRYAKTVFTPIDFKTS